MHVKRNDLNTKSRVMGDCQARFSGRREGESPSTYSTMNHKKREGDFYSSKVRLFLNEYGGINLEEFCKAERVSYSKMCNCLGRPSYRKPSVMFFAVLRKQVSVQAQFDC